MKVSQALAKHEAAPPAKKDVQVVKVAESVAESHEAFGGVAMV